MLVNKHKALLMTEKHDLRKYQNSCFFLYDPFICWKGVGKIWKSLSPTSLFVIREFGILRLLLKVSDVSLKVSV